SWLRPRRNDSGLLVYCRDWTALRHDVAAMQARGHSLPAPGHAFPTWPARRLKRTAHRKSRAGSVRFPDKFFRLLRTALPGRRRALDRASAVIVMRGSPLQRMIISQVLRIRITRTSVATLYAKAALSRSVKKLGIPLVAIDLVRALLECAGKA